MKGPFFPRSAGTSIYPSSTSPLSSLLRHRHRKTKSFPKSGKHALNGASFSKPALDYIKEMEGLGNRLYSAIFQSTGLSVDYLHDALPDIPMISISLHFYPPCPDPTLTLGINAHSDFASLTILLQGEVEGLQVFKDGQWVAVKPVPNAFVVNIGDQVEILTNGKYKSVEHRVVTNTKKARMSVACFFSPSLDARIAPLEKLVNETHPSLYKEVVSGKYMAEKMCKRYK